MAPPSITRPGKKTVVFFTASETNRDAGRIHVMNTITIGIDLAKNVFAVHGVNEAVKAVRVKAGQPSLN